MKRQVHATDVRGLHKLLRKISCISWPGGRFPPPRELISEGDPSDFLHIVIGSMVERFAGWNRRETIISKVRSISTVSLAPSLRDPPDLMSAHTMEKTRILLLPQVDVWAVFGVDAGFACAVLAEPSQSYRSVVETTKV